MQIIQATARVPSARFVVLSWRLVDPAPSAARIELFRSQDSTPGLKIAELPGTADRFVDRSVPTTWRLFSRLTYTIRATTPLSSTEAVARPEPAPSAEGLALADQLRTLLRTQYGRRCWHLPAMDYGQRCPDCYDEVRARTSRSHCRTCWDTTFVGGYGVPEAVWVSFQASDQILEQAGFAEIEASQTTCWLANDPDLAPRDLLIEPENRRWRVSRLKDFERQRTCFRQVALLDQIERDSIEYEIPLPQLLAVEAETTPSDHHSRYDRWT